MTLAYQATPCEERQQAEQLLAEYLPLIRYHADQLRRRVPDSVELDDLVDAGVLGLLDAAQRFDPERDVQFKTFVSFRVRGAMIDYLRQFDWMPRTLRESSRQMQQALLELEQRHGRPAEDAEVAAHLGISLEEYRQRLEQVRGMSVVYFDDLPKPHDGEEMDILETFEGDPNDRPETRTALHLFAERLADAIERLPARERVLLTLYYYEELNMKEVALVLGLTESRVSQIHSQMVLRLRGLMGLDKED